MRRDTVVIPREYVVRSVRLNYFANRGLTALTPYSAFPTP